jgi:hypothetical protein
MKWWGNYGQLLPLGQDAREKAPKRPGFRGKFSIIQ